MKQIEVMLLCKEKMEVQLFSIGCQNTPAKGCRYCPQHKEIARQYIDDDIDNAKIPDKSGGDNCLLIVKVVNEKTTRQGRMFEVTLNFAV